MLRLLEKISSALRASVGFWKLTPVCHDCCCSSVLTLPHFPGHRTFNRGLTNRLRSIGLGVLVLQELGEARLSRVPLDVCFRE